MIFSFYWLQFPLVNEMANFTFSSRLDRVVFYRRHINSAGCKSDNSKRMRRSENLIECREIFIVAYNVEMIFFFSFLFFAIAFVSRRVIRFAAATKYTKFTKISLNEETNGEIFSSFAFVEFVTWNDVKWKRVFVNENNIDGVVFVICTMFPFYSRHSIIHTEWKHLVLHFLLHCFFFLFVFFAVFFLLLLLSRFYGVPFWHHRYRQRIAVSCSSSHTFDLPLVRLHFFFFFFYSYFTFFSACSFRCKNSRKSQYWLFECCEHTNGVFSNGFQQSKEKNKDAKKTSSSQSDEKRTDASA